MIGIINHGIYWKEDLLSVELRVISGGNVNSFQSDTHDGLGAPTRDCVQLNYRCSWSGTHMHAWATHTLPHI